MDEPIQYELFFGPEALLGALIGALLLTLPISFFLLARYRRAVLKSMMSRADVPSPPAPPVIVTPSPPAAPPQGTSPNASLPAVFLDAGADIPLSPTAKPLHDRFWSRPRQAALVYGIAGVVYAVLSGVLTLVASGMEVLPQRTAVTILTGLWPVVLTLPLVWREPGWKWYPAALGVYFGLSALAAQEYFVKLVLLYWAVTWLVPTVAVWILANREVRAVGPFVLVTSTLLIFTWGVLLVLGYWLLTHVSAPGTEHIVSALPFVALALSIGASWLYVRAIARAHERHWLGEQSALVDCYYAAFTVWQTLSTVSSEGARGALQLLPFVGYRIVVAIGMSAMRRAAAAERPRRLLLLRVFGSRSRSERLFEAVAAHWRYAGSIQMIAGTDLASATLEPHEFLDFMGGTLSRRFIKGRADLSERLARLDTRPDADGRFPVNEFFCHDDTWQDVLLHLVAESDVVLMDLRTFSPQRQGCVFELHQLLNLIPLGRVILLVDNTTDVPFLRSVLEQGWADLAAESPNRDGRGGTLRVLNLPAGKDAADTLLTLLAEAGTFAARPSPPTPDLPPGVPSEMVRYG